MAYRSRLVGLVLLGALVPGLVLLSGKYPLDLDVYRHGANALRDGTPLYDVRLGRYGFTYPPGAAALFTAVGLLPLAAATLVASAGSLLALGCGVSWTCGPALRRVGGSALLVVAALVVSDPVRETVWNGQVNLVLMAFVLADLLRVTPARGRGLLIGVATAIKLTPGLFVVYLVVRGRRDDARRAVAAFLLITVSAALWRPADSLRFWTHEVFAGSGIGDLSRVANQSLEGVLLRMGAGQAWWIALAVPTALAGLALAARVSRAGREPVAAGIVGVTACLLSPVSWEHHWVWALPLLGGLAGVLLQRWHWWAVAVACLVLDVGPMELPRGWPLLPWVAGNAFVLTAIGGALVWGALAGRTPVVDRRSAEQTAGRRSDQLSTMLGSP